MVKKSNKEPELLQRALEDPFKKKHRLCIIFATKEKFPGFKGWQKHAKDDQTDEDIINLYKKLGKQNTAYSYFTGIGGLIDIDLDWPWLYEEALKHLGDRLDTYTLQTPNGGYRLLFLTDEPDDYLEYKSKPPYIEIHGKPTHHVVVYGQALNERGELTKYRVINDKEIRYDPNILKDFKNFIKKVMKDCYFLEYPCIKSILKGKNIELTQEQRTSIGGFFAAENIDLEIATSFFSCTDDFDPKKTRYHLKLLYDKGFKHPTCKKLIKNFEWDTEKCYGCARKTETINPKVTVETKDYTITNLDCCLDIIKEGNPLQSITETIGRYVKNEDQLIQLILLVMTSAYTPNPLNMALEGPHSEGKSYPLTQVAKIFPPSDVWQLGGMSPAALRREKGKLMDRVTGQNLEPQIAALKKKVGLLGDSKDDRKRKELLKSQLVKIYEKGVNTINLEGKILLFLEAPDKKTFRELRPIMSRDAYEITYKYVDRAYQHGPQVTLEARIKGWPVAIYATADAPKGNIWKQIRSRFIVVSPTMNRAKYRSANQLTAATYGGWSIPDELGQEDHEIQRATRYIRLVKQALYSVFIETSKKGYIPPDKIRFTKNPMSREIESNFPHNEGQRMRDFRDFLALMDASCLFNLFNRPYIEIQGHPHWIVTEKDLQNIKDILGHYHFFVKDSELPLQFYQDVIEMMNKNPDYELEEGVDGDGYTKADIKKAMKQVGYEKGNTWLNEYILTPLEDLGLLEETQNTRDKRRKIYIPNSQEIRRLSPNHIFETPETFKNFKKEFQEVENITTFTAIPYANKYHQIPLESVIKGNVNTPTNKCIINVIWEHVYTTPIGESYFYSTITPVDTSTNQNLEVKKRFDDKSYFSKAKEGQSTNFEIEELEAKARSGDQDAYDDLSAHLLKDSSRAIPMLEYDEDGNIIPDDND